MVAIRLSRLPANSLRRHQRRSGGYNICPFNGALRATTRCLKEVEILTLVSWIPVFVESSWALEFLQFCGVLACPSIHTLRRGGRQIGCDTPTCLIPTKPYRRLAPSALSSHTGLTPSARLLSVDGSTPVIALI